ncbi:MAG: alpha/beta hydrolase [Faecalibacterium sp.]
MLHFTKSIGNCGATLTAYIHDYEAVMPQMETRPAILICPGGGYAIVSPREGEPIALAFMKMGFHAFVLQYTVQGAAAIEETGKVPEAALGMQPLSEIAEAMQLIRGKAAEWRVIPDKIAVCGFSAGAHLAGSLGVLYANPELCAARAATPAQLRPDAMILSYPVISEGEFAHVNSFLHLAGEDAPQAVRDQYSLEKQVDANTPPAFLWHTVDDAVVPVENSLLMATALQKNKVPFEMHLFDSGIHGLSLCTASVNTPNPHASAWLGLCEEWLKKQFNLAW